MTDTVLVLGYFGFGNAGDDAIGVSTVQQLLKRMTPKRVIVTVGPKTVFDDYEVQTISYYSFIRLFQIMIKTDRIVMTGGTHFHTQGEFNNRLKVFSFYLLMILWAKFWRTEVTFLAHGFGPLNGPLFRSLATIVLRLADSISVRDRQSLKVIESLRGAPSESVVLGFDVVPLLDNSENPSLSQSAERGDSTTDEESITLGVSLTPAYKEYYNSPEKDNRLVKELSDALLSLSYENESIDSVVIFVLHSGELNDDISMSRKLESELDGVPTRMRLYQNCPDAFLTDIREVDRFVGMRYHSLVFSFIQSIPTLGISYHPKCLWFQQYTGYSPEATVSMHDVVESGIQDPLKKLITKPEAYESSMTIDEVRSLARESFAAICPELSER